MADYYTQFSVMIPYDTDEEREWLLTRLGRANGSLCENCINSEDGCTCPGGFIETEDTGGFLFEDDPKSTVFQPPQDAIWVYDDCGYANVNPLIDVVAEYQEQFHRTDPWELEYAHTCSKPRIDGFGGGKVLVYKGEIHYLRQDPDAIITSVNNLADFEQTLPAL